MDKSSGFTSEFKTQELRKKLLDCLQKEGEQFSELIRPVYAKDQLSKEEKTKLLSAIVQAVNHVLAAGDWNSSLFLRNTVKPLIEIKAEAEAELALQQQEKSGVKTITLQPLTENEVEVYISLFQSEGYNMNKWAVQLRSLDRYMVGRPVYKNEADVEKRIRLRTGAASEAYVVVVVKKSDIQMDRFQAPLKDQFDHPLLLLKETAVRTGRIIAFVHQETRYYFVNGQLIKETRA